MGQKRSPWLLSNETNWDDPPSHSYFSGVFRHKQQMFEPPWANPFTIGHLKGLLYSQPWEGRHPPFPRSPQILPLHDLLDMADLAAAVGGPSQDASENEDPPPWRLQWVGPTAGRPKKRPTRSPRWGPCICNIYLHLLPSIQTTKCRWKYTIHGAFGCDIRSQWCIPHPGWLSPPEL